MGSHSDFSFFSLWKEAAQGWLFQEIRTTDALNGKKVLIRFVHFLDQLSHNLDLDGIVI